MFEVISLHSFCTIENKSLNLYILSGHNINKVHFIKLSQLIQQHKCCHFLFVLMGRLHVGNWPVVSWERGPILPGGCSLSSLHTGQWKLLGVTLALCMLSHRHIPALHGRLSDLCFGLNISLLGWSSFSKVWLQGDRSAHCYLPCA